MHRSPRKYVTLIRFCTYIHSFKVLHLLFTFKYNENWLNLVCSWVQWADISIYTSLQSWFPGTIIFYGCPHISPSAQWSINHPHPSPSRKGRRDSKTSPANAGQVERWGQFNGASSTQLCTRRNLLLFLDLAQWMCGEINVGSHIKKCSITHVIAPFQKPHCAIKPAWNPYSRAV